MPGEARLARRGAAPLAGNDVDEPRRRILPADDGLDDPDLADGGRHLVEGHGVHVLARLRRVELELGQGHLVKQVGKIGSHGKILLRDNCKRRGSITSRTAEKRARVRGQVGKRYTQSGGISRK